VLSAPADLSTADVRAGLVAGWGVESVAATYRPVGFGSHHWSVTDDAGRRWFVTADVATRSLEPALRTAAELSGSGLEFVVGPVMTGGGAATQPAGGRYLLSLFPHVDGESGDFGPHRSEDVAPVKALLARLHATSARNVEPIDLDVPELDELMKARVTTGDGPYGVRARALLAAKSGKIDELLAGYDLLRAGLPARKQWVVTHGEPHPGNFLRTPGGLRLVDWDTTRLAPAERDLWLVEDRPEDPAYAFFRLRWRLADIASFAAELSMPHADTEDTSTIFGYLRDCLD
jgi:spectinomycin phosphotransferase